jgi:hypothetical protein
MWIVVEEYQKQWIVLGGCDCRETCVTSQETNLNPWTETGGTVPVRQFERSLGAIRFVGKIKSGST